MLSYRQKYLMSIKNSEKRKKLIEKMNREEKEEQQRCEKFTSIIKPTNELRKPMSIEAYENYLSNKKKAVLFDSTVKVILIPEINDYKNMNLTNKLWYTKEDYDDFRIKYRHVLKYNSI